MRRLAATLLLAVLLAAPARAADAPIVRMETDFGHIDVRLFPEEAPNSVALFLRTTAQGLYDETYFHRLAVNFVLQAGGFRYEGEKQEFIGDVPAPIDEYRLPNDYATLAVARLYATPREASRQFAFNQADNKTLNKPQYNFTVFGEVADDESVAVMDFINSRPYVIDARGGASNSAFGELPVRNYIGGPVKKENLIFIHRIAVAPTVWPPYSMPFSLTPSAVSVDRGVVGTSVTVAPVPAGGYVMARIGDGRGAVQRVATTTGGPVRLELPVPPDDKRPITVTAMPPGVEDSRVVVR